MTTPHHTDLSANLPAASTPLTYVSCELHPWHSCQQACLAASYAGFFQTSCGLLRVGLGLKVQHFHSMGTSAATRNAQATIMVSLAAGVRRPSRVTTCALYCCSFCSKFSSDRPASLCCCSGTGNHFVVQELQVHDVPEGCGNDAEAHAVSSQPTCSQHTSC